LPNFVTILTKQKKWLPTPQSVGSSQEGYEEMMFDGSPFGNTRVSGTVQGNCEEREAACMNSLPLRKETEE
jgi:hypothetical protein